MSDRSGEPWSDETAANRADDPALRPPDPVTAIAYGDAGDAPPTTTAASMDYAPQPGGLEEPARAKPKRRHRLLRAVFFRPTLGGLAGALVLWFLSLWPSLLPRDWSMQAVVSGVCVAIGYLIGTWIGRAVHGLYHVVRRRPSRRVAHAAWFILLVVAVLVVVFGLVTWPVWQNEQRDLVAMAHVSVLSVVPLLPATLLVAAVLVLIGRLIGHGIAALERFLDARLPTAIALIITVALGAALFSVAVNDVVLNAFFGWANRSFGNFDTTTPPGIVQPTSELRSGGPGSLVPWDTLGYEGRNFAGGGPTVADIQAFAGTDAEVLEPIRVYTGLRSAPDVGARAQLAVQELDRTGAFDRDVLAVVTVTGTGWVDPMAARALETMHHGNTAIVAQQYSYLPSWISFLVDKDKAAEAGAALNEAVYQRWSELPASSRPKLIIYGISLGSFGTEGAFEGASLDASLANLLDRSDGVLLNGPTYVNPIWSQLRDGRAEGSPWWAPVYEDGRNVRSVNQSSDVMPPEGRWDEPRILYFHHPSDPVGTFSPDSIWRRPEWAEDPKGYDVPDRLTWFPVVTWVQQVGDLVAGFSTPSGHGHNYDANVVAGWAAVVPPDGWTDADSARLQQALGSG